MRRRAAANKPPVIVGGVTPPLFGPELNAELAKHRGRWVAVDLEKQRVVGAGGSVEEVIEQARAVDVDDPLVFCMPADPDRLYLL